MKFLNDEELETLKTKHRKEKNGFVRDRMKAVLLYNKNWTMKEVPDALFISIQSVSDYIKDYKKLLKPERGGWEEKLSKEQSEHLETHLQENIYLREREP